MLQSGCIPSLVDSGSLDTLRLSEDLLECPIASSVASREQTVQVLIVIIGVFSLNNFVCTTNPNCHQS